MENATKPLPDAHLNRRLMTEGQRQQLRQLYQGKFPLDIVPRLDAGHKDALTEDQATKLIAELSANNLPAPLTPGKPAAGADRVPATATSTLHEVLAANGEPAEEADTAGFATLEQRQQIISLLNHPRILRSEKTTRLLGINVYTVERAAGIIADLQQKIKNREHQPKAA